MYIVLEGEIQVQFDMKRKMVSESDISDLANDLELSGEALNKFIQARIANKLIPLLSGSSST